MNPDSTLSYLSTVNVRQFIKLTVYTLLLINFAFYIRDDWVIATHTMRNGGSLLDWTRAFAVTIEESAWIIMLILFELETYVLSDEYLSRRKAVAMHVVRFVCYAFLAHTLFAYGIYAYELALVTAIPDITGLCQLVSADVSFAANLEYTQLDGSNCKQLSSASRFFYIDPPEFLIVVDGAGLLIERQLAWVDVMELLTWLFILFAIEMTVYLQDRGTVKGMVISSLNTAKFLFYSLLWVAIFYWIYRGHWMFAWDEFVWIAGFMAIEMNVVEWRNEIIEDEQTKPPKDPIIMPQHSDD